MYVGTKWFSTQYLQIITHLRRKKLQIDKKIIGKENSPINRKGKKVKMYSVYFYITIISNKNHQKKWNVDKFRPFWWFSLNTKVVFEEDHQ